MSLQAAQEALAAVEQPAPSAPAAAGGVVRPPVTPAAPVESAAPAPAPVAPAVSAGRSAVDKVAAEATPPAASAAMDVDTSPAVSAGAGAGAGASVIALKEMSAELPTVAKAEAATAAPAAPVDPAPAPVIASVPPSTPAPAPSTAAVAVAVAPGSGGGAAAPGGMVGQIAAIRSALNITTPAVQILNVLNEAHVMLGQPVWKPVKNAHQSTNSNTRTQGHCWGVQYSTHQRSLLTPMQYAYTTPLLLKLVPY